MPSFAGRYVGNAPSITVGLEVGPIQIDRVTFLLDTGAAHILLVLPLHDASADLVQLYLSWPEETLRGLGTLRLRRAPKGSLYLTDRDGEPVEIAMEPVHILLYDVDDDGFPPLEIPPSLLGFQHRAFGQSQLLVDNANRRVILTYQEPFTPTRLE